MKKGIYINESIHGLIQLSEYEKRIISSIGFNRLHDVYQNSTVYLTFPSNRTKRFEHSIGTMKLCSDIFFNSVLNTEPDTLKVFYERFEKMFGNIISEIASNSSLCEQKLGGVTPDAIPAVEYDNLRHSLTPNNVPEQYRIIHLLLIQSIRAAALLHDIGHPPFSHMVENALKSVYDELKDLPDLNQHQKSYIQVMSKYFEDDKELHEQMGDEISDSILREIITHITDEDQRYPENVFEIMLLEGVRKIFANSADFEYLHRIIDSSLDGDRLDYVTRDSINSGMDSGKIDYKRIIKDMKIFIKGRDILFCIPLKAVNSIEDFIQRRFNIYKNIIYHHRVIKTDFLLEHTVKRLIEKHLETPIMQKQDKVLIPFDISGLWFPLGNATVTQKSNALSQWNDSWLMTVLKQIYYVEFYRNRNIMIDSPDYILSQQLSELLRNKKCYYSLIKRGENFKVIDDAAKTVFLQNEIYIEEQMRKVNELSRVNGDKLDAYVDTRLDIRGTLDIINELLGNTTVVSGRFMISFLSRHYKAIQIPSFERLIEDIIKDEAKTAFTNVKNYDIIIIFKSIKIGLDCPIDLYNNEDELTTLDKVSGISDILQLNADYLPKFYIYVLLKDGTDLVKEKRDSLLNSIGLKIGHTIIEQIEKLLKDQIKLMEV